MATPSTFGAGTRVRSDDEADEKSSRPAIVLAILVLLVAGFALRYGLQTLLWIEAKSWAVANPWIRDVPQPLPTPAGPATSKGTSVKAYDYEFTAPWAGEPKAAPSLAWVQFHFDSGQGIVVFNPDNQVDTLRELKASAPLEYQRFANVFADRPVETNYALYQAVYNAAPEKLSPFGPAREAMRMNVLLLWKLAFGPDAPGGVNSFDWNGNRGFQFGDPARGGPIALRIFDSHDRQFRFIFTVAPGSSAKVTQDDIDSIIQTFQTIPLTER